MTENRVIIEPLGPDSFALSFPYDDNLVAMVRRLGNRRWNKRAKRWEIGICHLGEVAQGFGVDPKTLDRKLWRAYQMIRIRGQRARVHCGPVLAHIEGDGLPFHDIDQATSFLVPGHQFMPRFVKGEWDGRRHLFDRRKHVFPAGLVDRVVSVLQGHGVDCCVSHEPEAEYLDVEAAPPDLVPRDYQAECVEKALEGRRGVLEMATGAGKTAVAGLIIQRLGRPAMFFVHTRDLLHQTRRAFEAQLGLPIGQVGDGLIDIRAVTVATIQTCARALGIELDAPPDEEVKLEKDKTDVQGHRVELLKALRDVPVVFFDECHHLPADCAYSLAMQTAGAHHRFGLSATPYRDDRQDMLLEAALGPKLYRANASLLIQKGFLVPPRIRFHAVPAFKVVTGRPDYQEIFQHYIVNNQRRNGMIAEQARGLAEQGRSVLILVSQVAHGEALRELLPDAPLVQGSDSASHRHHIFRELHDRRRLIVIATTLADEGLDIPSLRAVVLASGGKSETRALQRVGRALRTAPGKTEAIVVDFFDNAPYLKEHSMARLELFRNEPAFRVETVGFRA